MKTILYTFAFALLFFSCKQETNIPKKNFKELITNEITKPEFQTILDSAKVIGSILIYDLNKDVYYSNDFKWANKGQLPASTFKIVNSIIGLETGVIENENTVFKWDGKKKWLKKWEQDLILKDAFQFSCVPCYQKVARKIGSKKMNHYVSKFNYGNLKIDSTNIDQFWLQGKSKISQIQQIDFIKRLYNLELPISKKTKEIIKNIMLIEENEHYKLSGKTGLSINQEKYNGWFVGYIEVKNNTYLFATNIEPKGELNFDSFAEKRKKITLSELKKMQFL